MNEAEMQAMKAWIAGLELTLHNVTKNKANLIQLCERREQEIQELAVKLAEANAKLDEANRLETIKRLLPTLADDQLEAVYLTAGSIAAQRVDVTQTCETCGGSGQTGKHTSGEICTFFVDTCKACNGTGKVKQ